MRARILFVPLGFIALGSACVYETALDQPGPWSGTCTADYSDTSFTIDAFAEGYKADAALGYEGNWLVYDGTGTGVVDQGQEGHVSCQLTVCQERGTCVHDGVEVGTLYVIGWVWPAGAGMVVQGWLDGETIHGHCWPQWSAGDFGVLELGKD